MAYGNTDKTGVGTPYWLTVTSDGYLIIAGGAAEDAAVAGQPVLIGGRYDATARDLDDGDVGAVALDADGRVLTTAGWAPSLQADEDANDSDKKFTVPAATEWEILSVWVELTTTADAGNRNMAIEIQDTADDVILQVRAGIVQAASLTRYYLFAPGANELEAFRDTDYLSTAIPAGLVLGAGFDIRVWDSKAIQAAADDMIVQMLVKARTV